MALSDCSMVCIELPFLEMGPKISFGWSLIIQFMHCQYYLRGGEGIFQEQAGGEEFFKVQAGGPTIFKAGY